MPTPSPSADIPTTIPPAIVRTSSRTSIEPFIPRYPTIVHQPPIVYSVTPQPLMVIPPLSPESPPSPLRRRPSVTYSISYSYRSRSGSHSPVQQLRPHRRPVTPPRSPSPFIPLRTPDRDEKSALLSTPNPDSLLTQYAQTRPDPILVLEKTFGDCEKRRTDAFLEDDRNRNVFFDLTKDFIEKSSAKRMDQFRRLEQHTNTQLTSLQKRFTGHLASRDQELTTAESNRDSLFASVYGQMDTVFNDMLSMMEEQTESLQAVQHEQTDWCYQEVGGYLITLEEIVSQTRSSFWNHFSETMDTVWSGRGRGRGPNSPRVIIPHSDGVPIMYSSRRSRSRSRSRSPMYGRRRSRSYSPERRLRRFSPETVFIPPTQMPTVVRHDPFVRVPLHRPVFSNN